MFSSILVFSGYVPWSGIAGHILALFLVFKVISRRGCGEKGTLLHYWWECKLLQPLERSEWRFLKKLEINLPYNPTIPLLGIYPKETIIEKGACTPVFIAALFAIARTFKQPKCPLTDEWIKKLWYIHSMEYYSAIKRNACDSVLTRWMN